MTLNDLKIKTRLTLGFAAMAALTAVLGAVALANLVTIERQFAGVMEDRYVKVQVAGEIKAVNNDVSQALRNLFIMSDPDDMKAQYELIAGSSKKTNANMERLEKAMADDAGKAALAKLAEARAAYRAPRDKVIELLKAGRSEEAEDLTAARPAPAPGGVHGPGRRPDQAAVGCDERRRRRNACDRRTHQDDGRSPSRAGVRGCSTARVVDHPHDDPADR